ncbi:MAG: nuclease-related domain-containing protein, partial [Pyrinomonadaceae bacterium]
MPAYYSSSVSDFVKDDADRVVGILTTKSARAGFLNLKKQQTTAWQEQIENLKATFQTLARALLESNHWTILLEYQIPRRHKRIDAVLLARDVIFCIEFKTRAKTHNLLAQKQAED